MSARPQPSASGSWWEAVVNRDPSADGDFVFAVTTTGIYCRPSCPARRPRRDHARWFADPAAAESEGFRACKRCDPRGETQQAAAQHMTELCAFIAEHAGDGTPLDLASLARRVHMSVSTLQRVFKATVGVSPKAFGQACRRQSFRDALRAGKAVTEAIYEAGFGSSSRVYEHADDHLGMTPTTYRHRGQGLEISWATTPSPLGRLMVGATDRGICFVMFGDSDIALEQALAAEYPAAIRHRANPNSLQLKTWLEALRRHLDGTQPSLDLPLDLRASAFAIRVWEFLRTIPYASTRSYAEVATAIGAPGAARAVARACASNPAALLIPCHRVLRGTGELAGYRWGIERKRDLLDLERSAPPAG